MAECYLDLRSCKESPRTGILPVPKPQVVLARRRERGSGLVGSFAHSQVPVPIEDLWIRIDGRIPRDVVRHHDRRSRGNLRAIGQLDVLPGKARKCP